MAGCSVLGCTNRSEKGFIMKYFPKDPERRKEWIANMKRKNWTPTANAVICEVHFAPAMWEKTRVDGKRKLKRIAIPTLFNFAKPITVKETPNEPVTLAIEVADIYVPSTGTASKNTNDTDSTSVQCKCASDAEKRSIKALELKFREYSRQFIKLCTKYTIIKNNLQNCQKQLKAAMDVDENVQVMKTCFNEDQIKAMRRSSTKFVKWSTATVRNSLKLKSACGINGYKELLRQKYPLPSLRTLRRHQEKLKLETTGLCEV